MEGYASNIKNGYLQMVCVAPFFFGIMFSNHPIIKMYCLNNFKKKSCQKLLSLITLILYSPSNTLGT